ncbi:MAG: hypothetical protein ACOCZM_03465 [Bacillota bacterium]
MKKIYSGPGGTGKTTKLKQLYQQIVRDHGSEVCPVFVKNAAAVSEWMKDLKLEVMGPRNVFTYFGFIRGEILGFWPQVEENLPGGRETVEPAFMTVETAHYLMSKYVENQREKSAIFDYINATSARIAVQLIDNLNQAAVNGLSFSRLKERLLAWAGNDREKILVFNTALDVMKKFRRFCRKSRILDYSLLVDLYNRCLLESEDYIETLGARFDYLFVDDLEKTVPSAQGLFLQFLEDLEGTFFAYNPQGGINRFFGGRPERARELFFPRCEIVELKEAHNTSRQAEEISQALYRVIFAGDRLPVTDFIREPVTAEYRGNMLEEVIDSITKMIAAGTSPGRIALIAPGTDKVMEFTLAHHFREEGIPFKNLNRSRRLVDIPFARALITLTLLTNPDWKTEVTFSALQQTLGLLLEMDPVRSSALAEKIMQFNLDLPRLEELDLQSDLDSGVFDRYRDLRLWIGEKRGEEIELETFFQSVFRELLAPHSPDRENILACRQMINSVSRFKEVIGKFKQISEKETGYHFIDMIYEGTLAAEVLSGTDKEKESVLLATPYKFLFSPEAGSVDYLFLLDISSSSWLQGVSKELVNPYIISRGQETKWTDELDRRLRKKQLLDFLQSLLGRCKKGIIPADSYLNSRGWEQDGPLYDWLLVKKDGEEDD